MTLFQGVNGRFPYIPRRHEVRLPYAQGDDIRASRDQVKKFPDAGTGYGAYLLRYFVLPIHDHSFLNGRELRSDSQAFCLHGSFKHTTVFLVGFQMEVCGSGQHPFQRRKFSATNRAISRMLFPSTSTSRSNPPLAR